MGLNGTTRRRWLGGLMLLSALALLIAGETVLKAGLQGWVFLLYWLLCLALTGAAIVVAFLDARAVRRKSHEEARDLIERTLGKIETDVRDKSGSAGCAQEDGRRPSRKTIPGNTS